MDVVEDQQQKQSEEGGQNPLHEGNDSSTNDKHGSSSGMDVEESGKAAVSEAVTSNGDMSLPVQEGGDSATPAGDDIKHEENAGSSGAGEDTSHTADQAEEDKPNAAASAPQILLRGSLDMTTFEYSGKWGYGEAAFQPGGLVGDFQYKKESATMMMVSDPAAASSNPVSDTANANSNGDDQPPPPPPPPPSGQLLPSELVMSGYFMLAQQLPKGPRKGMQSFKKIKENTVVLTFKRSEEGKADEFDVQGSGSNQFGAFSLSGTFQPSSGDLNVRRQYIPQLNKVGSTVSSILKDDIDVKHSADAASPLSSNNAGGDHEPSRAEKAKRVVSPPLSADAITKGQNVQRNMQQIVTRLMKADQFAVFHFPVDHIKLGLKDYLDVVKTPMDLGTVNKRLNHFEFQTEEDVARDVELVFHNAMQYNPAESNVHIMAKQFLEQFQSEFQKVLAKRATGGSAMKPKRKRQPVIGDDEVIESDEDSDLSVDENDFDDLESGKKARRKGMDDGKGQRQRKRPKTNDGFFQASSGGSAEEEIKILKTQMAALSKQVQQLQRTIKQMNPGSAYGDLDWGADMQMPTPTARPRPAPNASAGLQTPSSSRPAANRPSGATKKSAGANDLVERKAPQQKALLYEEKRQLGQDIRSLPGEAIAGVIEIIQKNNGKLGGNDEEVEIDIDILETPALRALQKYVKEVLGKKSQSMF